VSRRPESPGGETIGCLAGLCGLAGYFLLVGWVIKAVWP
jgi:hypothetical protein